jgi:hypothetical protein
MREAEYNQAPFIGNGGIAFGAINGVPKNSFLHFWSFKILSFMQFAGRPWINCSTRN